LSQGRLKTILADREAYLLALCGYVGRNPVADCLADESGSWPWSSCRAHLGLGDTPPWLDSDGLHCHPLGRRRLSVEGRLRACRLYADVLGSAQRGAILFS
jgi:putative transposase